MLALVLMLSGCALSRHQSTAPHLECKHTCDGKCENECTFTGPEKDDKGIDAIPPVP